MRRAGEENASMSDAVALEAPVVGVNEDIVSITAMCSDDIGHLIYAGRDDGSVVSYEVSTGTFSAHVHSHAQGLFISAIAFREGTIGSADVGGRVIVQKLSSKPEQINGGSHLLQLDMMAPVQQLIFNDDASRLLVATARSKAILDVLGKRRLEETVEPPMHVKYSPTMVSDWARAWALFLKRRLSCIHGTARSLFRQYHWIQGVRVRRSARRTARRRS